MKPPKWLYATIKPMVTYGSKAGHKTTTQRAALWFAARTLELSLKAGLWK